MHFITFAEIMAAIKGCAAKYIANTAFKRTNRTIMKNLTRILVIALAAVSAIACSRIDNYRVPFFPVHIDLDNTGLWNTYGVSGVGIHRSFIRELKVPANFPYTELTYTGFAGVLLICDINNEPLAYDLCCPVEVSEDTRVFINDDLEAECPVCGSRFNVIEAYGTPVYGPAVERKYGLQRYKVVPASLGGYIIRRN